ncbi:hypothetical protein D3C86_1386550 [compost metagenome]
MRIRTDHHTAGKCIVFQYYLVDDARTGFPEAQTITVRYGRKEIVYFFIGIHSYL